MKRDVVVRALKTFAQAFLAGVAAGLMGVVDWNTGKALVLSALAAGISAAWNVILQVRK
jgi:hypothetical protein